MNGKMVIMMNSSLPPSCNNNHLSKLWKHWVFGKAFNMLSVIYFCDDMKVREERVLSKGKQSKV